MKIEAKFSIILLFWYTEFIFHFFVNNRALSSLQVTINLPLPYSFVYLGGIPTYSLAPCVVFNIHCNLDMLLRVGEPWVWPQGCSKGNIRDSHLKESGYSLLFLHCNYSARGKKVIISWQDFLFFPLHFVSATLPLDPSDWAYKFAKSLRDFLSHHMQPSFKCQVRCMSPLMS